MHDWYLLLTPLALLPIVALFACVGCTLPRIAFRPTVTLTFQVPPDASGMAHRWFSEVIFTLQVGPLPPHQTASFPPHELHLLGSAPGSPPHSPDHLYDMLDPDGSSMPQPQSPMIDTAAGIYQVTIQDATIGTYTVSCSGTSSARPFAAMGTCVKTVDIAPPADPPAPPQQIQFNFQLSSSGAIIPVGC
jgi:hypothetical protein